MKEPRLAGDDRWQHASASRRHIATKMPLLATDVTMIMVPTPSGSDGRFSMKYVMEAAEEIGAALQKKAKWHLVVLSSTVMPGSTGGTLLPALEEITGKEMRPRFRPLLQPRVHCARQRGSRHAATRHDPDRRIGSAIRRDLWKILQRRLRKQSAHPAHEFCERGTDQALGQYLRDYPNFLRQYAGAGLRNAARRRCGRGDCGNRLRHAHRTEVSERRAGIWRPVLSAR